MDALDIALLVIMSISALFTIILILMHSGKGTGVSDMIAASMYNASAGSGVWEKNLDRLTVFFALLFGLCIIIMALHFPVGALTSAM